MSARHSEGQKLRRGGERLLKMLRETGPRGIHVCIGLVGEAAFNNLRRKRRIKLKGAKRGAKWAAV